MFQRVRWLGTGLVLAATFAIASMTFPNNAEASCGNFYCGCPITWDCASNGACEGPYCPSGCGCLDGTIFCWCEA